jgi:SAM-dependent methyltransferase
MLKMVRTVLGNKLSLIAKIRKKPRIIPDFIKAKIIFSRRDENETRKFISHIKLEPSYIRNADAPLPLNKVVCIEDWENLEFRKTLTELSKGTFPSYFHRKHWEWTMGIIALKRLGKLNNSSRAIGVGAGKEDVIFYLANNVGHVNATDLYRSDWDESPRDFVTDPDKYAPFEYRKERLSVARMDGTKLDFPSKHFDIAFSFSSIEHFGGSLHSGALRSLKEIERVLKPDGIAVVATEYVMNGKEHREYFNEENIFSDLLDKLEMKLVEPLDLQISSKTVETVMDFYSAVKWHSKDENYKINHPNIVLRSRNVLHTSIMLVFKKDEL